MNSHWTLNACHSTIWPWWSQVDQRQSLYHGHIANVHNNVICEWRSYWIWTRMLVTCYWVEEWGIWLNFAELIVILLLPCTARSVGSIHTDRSLEYTRWINNQSGLATPSISSEGGCSHMMKPNNSNLTCLSRDKISQWYFCEMLHQYFLTAQCPHILLSSDWAIILDMIKIGKVNHNSDPGFFPSISDTIMKYNQTIIVKPHLFWSTTKIWPMYKKLGALH